MSARAREPLPPLHGRGYRLHRLYVERLLVTPVRGDPRQDHLALVADEGMHEPRRGAAHDHAPPYPSNKDCDKSSE